MKKIVITGATSGIGYELAKIFAGLGWHLILVNRNQEKTNIIVEKLKREFADNCEVDSYICDLFDLQAIKATFMQVAWEHPQINALINNAGVLLQKLEGNDNHIDIHFHVNTIAPILIGELLRPALKHADKKSGNSIIVNLSSDSIFHTHELNPEKIKNPSKAGVFGAYGQSKLALTAITRYLAEEFEKDGINMFAINPGATRTKMAKGFIGWFYLLLPTPFSSAKKIARPIIEEGFNIPTGSLLSMDKVKRIPKNGGDGEIMSKTYEVYKSCVNL